MEKGSYTASDGKLELSAACLSLRRLSRRERTGAHGSGRERTGADESGAKEGEAPYLSALPLPPSGDPPSSSSLPPPSLLPPPLLLHPRWIETPKPPHLEKTRHPSRIPSPSSPIGANYHQQSVYSLWSPLPSLPSPPSLPQLLWPARRPCMWWIYGTPRDRRTLRGQGIHPFRQYVRRPVHPCDCAA